jgi:hypothetical protein
MVARKCKWCGDLFQARSADAARGWAIFCSKSCKAKKQEARTGQNARYQARQSGAFPRDADGCFQMSPAELAMGGYGDAAKDTPFSDGKW